MVSNINEQEQKKKIKITHKLSLLNNNNTKKCIKKKDKKKKKLKSVYHHQGIALFAQHMCCRDEVSSNYVERSVYREHNEVATVRIPLHAYLYHFVDGKDDNGYKKLDELNRWY